MTGAREGQGGSWRGRLRGRPEQRQRRQDVSYSEAALPQDTEDHWLDEVTDPPETKRRRRARLYDTFAAPAAAARRMWQFISTTPGKMVTLTLILALAIFAAGYSMSQSAQSRQADLDVLLSTTEPTSYSTHHLYTSLSYADTLATTSMLLDGVESHSAQHAYYRALDRASQAASAVAAGLPSGDERSAELIASIQRQVPVYAGLIETARVNHRQGNPVAISYIAEASALMREDILVDASELFRQTSNEVREQQAQLARPQWVPLSGLGAAVLFLLIAQWWLWRITRRRLNRGFLAATALMIVAIVWVSGSNIATWYAGNQGFERATQPWDSLTDSRILAQESRTEEVLSIVRRQQADGLTSGFESSTAAIESALDDAEGALSEAEDSDAARGRVAAAREALADWEDGHAALRDALRGGEFDEAVTLASEPAYDQDSTPTAAAAYRRLDDALADLIAESRSAMRVAIADGLAATRLVSFSVLALSLAAVIAVVAGIRPRLQEYL